MHQHQVTEFLFIPPDSVDLRHDMDSSLFYGMGDGEDSDITQPSGQNLLLGMEPCPRSLDSTPIGNCRVGSAQGQRDDDFAEESVGQEV